MKVFWPKYMYFWYYLQFSLFTMKNCLSQNCKNIFLPEICTSGRNYSHTLWSENFSPCSCKCYSLKFTQHATVTQTESNQEVTKKGLISMLLSTQKLALEYKLICVRCRNCSYNKIARSIGLLDKIASFVYTGKFSYK